LGKPPRYLIDLMPDSTPNSVQFQILNPIFTTAAVRRSSVRLSLCLTQGRRLILAAT